MGRLEFSQAAVLSAFAGPSTSNDCQSKDPFAVLVLVANPVLEVIALARLRKAFSQVIGIHGNGASTTAKPTDLTISASICFNTHCKYVEQPLPCLLNVVGSRKLPV